MHTDTTRQGSIATLFWVASVLQTGARHARAAAKRLDAWFEMQGMNAGATGDLRTMSDRELFDIGLTRADVLRMAWAVTSNPQPAAAERAETRSRRDADRAALVRCSLYLYVGYVGAATLVVGLLRLLLDGQANPLSALAMMLGGGVLAATSWRRARAIVELAVRDFESEIR